MPSILTLLFFVLVSNLFAEDLLQDRTGDEALQVMSFGDSIAYGRGDTHDIGEFVENPDITNGTLGYLKRVREQAGISTVNHAIPGELLTEDGYQRFAGIVANSNADLIGILEGTNDAGLLVSASSYKRRLQQMINIAKAQGRLPVLFTVLPPCCAREGRQPFTKDFSAVVRFLANINDLPVADIEKAWETTCVNQNECELYNKPDGLHPNRSGYDVISHVFLASLYGINIFAPEGARQLEEALGLEEGTVSVQPDPALIPSEEQSE